MFDVSQDELQGVVQHLDQAIYNHEQWHKDLTRTLICQLPYDQRDVMRDAHRHCRFGQWYYTLAEEFLICMQYTDAKAGYEVVERLREGLAAISAAHNAAKAAGRNCTRVWDPSMQDIPE